jgi:PKD repeat protein
MNPNLSSSSSRAVRSGLGLLAIVIVVGITISSSAELGSSGLVARNGGSARALPATGSGNSQAADTVLAKSTSLNVKADTPGALPLEGAAWRGNVGSAGAGVYWSNLTSGSSPSTRLGAAMGWDPQAHDVLLFGGQSGPYGLNSGYYGKDLNDTWTFSNGSWTNITSSAGVAPPGREFASLTYDPQVGGFLLVGGQAGGLDSKCAPTCSDTWEFSAGQWHNLNVTVPTEWGFTASYDPNVGGVIGLNWQIGVSNQGTGGATFLFQNGSWISYGYNNTTNTTGPSPDYWHASLADDPAIGGLILFGGRNSAGRSYPETWEFSNGNWTNLTTSLATSPPATPYPNLVYDSNTGKLIASDTGTLANGGTWLFSGTWQNVSNATHPPNLTAASIGWDNSSTSAVSFGGAWEAGAGAQANETWEWSATPDLAGLHVSASPNPSEVASNLSFVYSVLGGDAPFAFNWSFGDGSSSSTANPVHAYAEAGQYSVLLTLADSSSESLTARLAIVISPTLTLHPEGVPNPTDVGLTTSFAANPSGGTAGVSYTYAYGDGQRTVSPSTVANHTYAAPGTYKVSVLATDAGGGNVSESLFEQVNPVLSVAGIEVSSSDPMLGQPVGFSTSISGGSAPYSVDWSFGDGSVGSGLLNITHAFTTDGQFDVEATVGDASGASVSTSTTIFISLNATIVSDATIGAAPLNLTFFDASATGNSPVSYLWAFGDGTSSLSGTPTHEFYAPGAYSVTLTVRGASGESAFAARLIQTFTGGGPLTLELGATPLQSTSGMDTAVAAIPSGGAGAYNLSWLYPQGACRASSVTGLTCVASPAGAGYLVVATLRDSTGVVATASVETLVAGPSHTGSPFKIPVAPVAVVGIVAFIAVALIVRRAVRRSDPEVGVRLVVGKTGRGEDPYFAFRGRAPPAPHRPPSPAGSDPLDELL